MIVRCRSALEAPVPDVGDGYENSTLILQCEREDGHKGVHRYSETVTWPSDQRAK